MNRFIIVDGLPYLYVHGKVFAVRWGEKGFTVGAEVEMASVPEVTYPEISIKAKCADLDSIKGAEPVTEIEKPLSEMSLEELKGYAKAHGIKLGSARTKDAIIEAIADALI
ncbi:MAG: hypothetical protein IKW21_01395 [Lachnospiraceae bacterium]|nr:hypothetical protein [Lachnospiraceae bacterium]